MRRAATLPHGSTTHGETTMPELKKITAAPRCRAEVKRDCFAEPVIGPAKGRTRWLAMTADVVMERQILSLRGARSATKQSAPRGETRRPKCRPDGPRANCVLAKRTQRHVLA